MNNSDEQFFSLKVSISDGSSMVYRFTQEASIGSDPRNDIILIGGTISAKHIHIKNESNCLKLKFTGEENTTRMNGTWLLKNKMYIVDKKDSIQIETTKIIIL